MLSYFIAEDLHFLPRNIAHYGLFRRVCSVFIFFAILTSIASSIFPLLSISPGVWVFWAIAIAIRSSVIVVDWSIILINVGSIVVVIIIVLIISYWGIGILTRSITSSFILDVFVMIHIYRILWVTEWLKWQIIWINLISWIRIVVSHQLVPIVMVVLYLSWQNQCALNYFSISNT